MLATSRAHTALNRSTFALQIFDNVAGLASVASIPGIKIAASITLAIVDIAKKVKTSAEECLVVADQCAELVVVVAEATGGKSIADADPQLPADLARLTSRLEQIRDAMLKQMSRSTLRRVIDHIGDTDNIAKCKELLNQCYQIFQVQSSIALRRYLVAEGRRRLLPQPLLGLSSDTTVDVRPPPRIMLVHGNDAHPSLRNSSLHPIMYNGLRYPTALHLFWSLKIPSAAEKIRTCGESTDEASAVARSHRSAVRADWALIQVAANNQILLCKFMQYPCLLQELQGTGHAEIINDTTNSFWGMGKDGRGRNELGKSLMRVRQRPPWPLLNVSSGTSTGVHPRRRVTLLHGKDARPSLRNNSPHPIMYNGLRYPTALHLFWSLEIPTLAEQIRTCGESTNRASGIVRSNRDAVRPDWPYIQLAAGEQVLLCKFVQYPGLIRELLETDDAEIINDSTHKFWGLGEDGKGRNELGKALERLRATLRVTTETVPALNVVVLQK